MKKKKYKKLAKKWFEAYLQMRDRYQYDMGRVHQSWKDYHEEFNRALNKFVIKEESCP